MTTVHINKVTFMKKMTTVHINLHEATFVPLYNYSTSSHDSILQGLNTTFHATSNKLMWFQWTLFISVLLMWE